MTQKHYAQNGTFHITTNTKGKLSWLTESGVPEILIDNLFMTRNVQSAEIFAFCILPNHMHILMRPGEKGLSDFMHSFKRNSSKDVRCYLRDRSGKRTRAAVYEYVPHRSRGSFTPAVNIGWQNGFHDERIRDADQRSNALSYIKYNAAKHHIVDDIDHWPWSSHHFKHLLDPMEIWFDSPYDPS